MDIANATESTLVALQAQTGTAFGVTMLRQAARQDATVLQLVAAAVQAAPRPGNGERIDITV